MIDLHIHTNYSDGTYTVEEILREAEKRKLEIISITDHDTIKAYEELNNIKIKDYYSGILINGCEMKCVYQGMPIEILGYDIDLEKFKKSKNLGNFKEKYLNIQKEYLDYLKQVGRRIGLVFDEKLDINRDKMQYASDLFQKAIEKDSKNLEILKQYHISLEPNFYRAEQCNPDSIFYINENNQFPKVEDIIEEIHEAGGLAFLAHPYIYPFENTIQTVEEMIKSQKLDGLECYYSYFSEEQTGNLVELCRKYNLYMSGGTDFHGKNRPDTELGIGTGNLKIGKEIVQNWTNNCNNIH